MSLYDKILSLVDSQNGNVIATSEPADSQVSSFSPARTISLSSYDKILSLVASQSVTSLRPLNWQIAKSHLLVRQGLFLCHHTTNFELGGFSIGYVIATSERQIAKSHPSVRQGLFLCHHTTNFELDGFLIGYVIATSEPADSQVSSFSPVRTIFSNV